MRNYAMLASAMMAAGMLVAAPSRSIELDPNDPLNIKDKPLEPRDSYDPMPLVPYGHSRTAGVSKYTPHVGAKQQAKGLKALERQRTKEAGL